MRKLVLDAAVTLDNFIARPGGDMSLLRCSDEAGACAKSLWDGAGAPLLGGFSRKVDLNQQSCEPIADGCILATYEPA